VREVDEFISEAKRTRIASDIIFTSNKEYDVIDYGDRVEVIVEVGDNEPDIRYSGGKFIVEYGSNVREFDVGVIDKESIDAKVVNGVLSIKARRVKDVGEAEESDKQE